MERFPPGAEYDTLAGLTADAVLLLAGTQWAAPTVHLIDAPVTILPTTVVGDLSEASYTGYAAVALGGFTGPQYESNGSIRYQGDTLASFTGPSAGSGPTIYGWFMKGGGAGTPLLRITMLDTPVVLTDNHVTLNIIPTLTLSPPSV